MSDCFRIRVAQFWRTFEAEESFLREMIDKHINEEERIASQYVGNVLTVAFNEINFQIGVNLQNKYELILSPEGDRVKLILLNYWLAHAPEHLFRKWSFHASMPALKNTSFEIEMYGITLREEDIILYPKIDNERFRFDLEVFSPKLLTINDSERYTLLFLFLDQYISEVYTIEQIGDIMFVPIAQNQTSIKFKDLKREIDSYINIHNWIKTTNPIQSTIGYRRSPLLGEENILRREIHTGHTSCAQAINAYITNNSEYLHKYNEEGVEFGFIYYSNNQTSIENIISIRNLVEAEIAKKTIKAGIAENTGAAIGENFSYLDYIIYDIQLFMDVVKNIVSEFDFYLAGFSFFNPDRDTTHLVN